MIKSIKLSDSFKLEKYVTRNRDLSSTLIGKTFEFHPCYNIIIGPNGSGKSTLLNILKKLTLCDNVDSSEVKVVTGTGFFTRDILNNNNLLSTSHNDIFDGIELDACFDAKYYNCDAGTESNNSDTFAISTLRKYAIGGRSKGESVIDRSCIVVDNIFKDFEAKTYEYPINELKTHAQRSDSVKAYLDFIESVKFTGEGGRFTIFADEPDNNLDIDNCFNCYNYWFGEKNQGNSQLITVIHNPLIIYKLAMRENFPGKFIELEEGYLDKVVKTVKNFLQ